MKKILLFITLFAFAQTAFTQSSKKVPAAVKAAFAKAYPTAADVDWEIEDGNFEAEYEMADNQEMSVVYDANGTVIETEVPIAFRELPMAVQTAVKGKKVKETTKITNSKGVVTYEVGVRRKDMMFDAQGNAIK